MRGIFDEIVVVDTGSTDRTVEIARPFGAKVFDFVWVDSFSAARSSPRSSPIHRDNPVHDWEDVVTTVRESAGRRPINRVDHRLPLIPGFPRTQPHRPRFDQTGCRVSFFACQWSGRIVNRRIPGSLVICPDAFCQTIGSWLSGRSGTVNLLYFCFYFCMLKF